MCGIVGVVYKDAERLCDESILVNMRDQLVHRGPDDEGLFIERNVGLGHRRLSIIDISGGHQPMTNEDGSLWIVCNGEVYNFKTLREELIKKGHHFKTKSDTEVILHLYEERDVDCVKDLNGMFAFAIWDRQKRSLLLGRDRMGIKPLYYAETPEAFVFASEIKALFKSGQISAQCNDQAVPEYFIFRQVAGEETLFRGVKQLLPAHTLSISEKSISCNQYWSPFPEEINHRISSDEAAEKLTYLLRDSIKIRLMSDVPLGTFCSGGVDSSLVTAMAAKLVDQPVNTFSVGFYEDEYDESQFASLVSSQYETVHHQIKLNAHEFLELLPKMIWHNDEPLNFANSIQMYAVSKLAKSYVTVVLTGEGSDELFAGYPRYLIPGLSGWFRKVPKFVQKLLSISGRLMGDHRIEKLGFHDSYEPEELLLYNSGFLNKKFTPDVIGNGNKVNLSFRKGNLSKSASVELDLVSRLSLLDQQTYLVSILNRQDKMSMAASIESRVPFLDYRVVELANRLPSKFKIRHSRGKVIVKNIARPYLPDKIVHRRKSGFGVPLNKWMKDVPLVEEVLEKLVHDNSLVEFFGKHFVRNLVSEFRSESIDHSEFLWSTINFTVWREIFKV